MTETSTPREVFNARIAELQKGAATPVWEVGIPMRDTIELSADVYLPLESQRPAPAILQFTPYDKSNQSWFVPEARYYQERGYAYVIADARGRGKSEGDWRPWVHDGRDGHDVVEWIAEQPWCTGKVGTSGLSYNGWTQWAIANEHPPHLACMISTAAAGQFMQEIPFTFGVFQLYFVWWLRGVRRRIAQGYGGRPGEIVPWLEVLSRLPVGAFSEFVDPSGPGWRDMMEHDRLDDFWRSLRFDGHYDGIDVPCLHVNGWFDVEDLLGGMHHYEQMVRDSPAASQQRLIVGPWSHVNTRVPHSSYGGLDFGPEGSIDIDAEHEAWFDHWLKDVDNGVGELPPVEVFETGANAWRRGPSYPRAVADAALFLRFEDGAGRLAAAPADADPPQSFTYDPLDPAPTLFDVAHYPLADMPLDQTPVEARPDVLAYTSEPLDAPLTISGWPFVDLHASTDGDDTDWHVKLTDVWPDGRSIRVASGCLRGANHRSLEEPEPLAPGQPYRFSVELNPVQHRFLVGHRIRVTVTSSDFPWFARSMNRFGRIEDLADPRTAVNTIHHTGELQSRLRLPVEDGSIEQALG